MKEKWSSHTEQIIHELISVIANKLNIFLYTDEEPSGLITTATHVCSYDGEDYLFLKSDGGLKTGQRGFLVYKQPGGELSRGFTLEIKKSTKKMVAISLPKEIFQIQRRKHPRIKTPQGSVVNFYIKDEHILNTLKVMDITMSSARLTGGLTNRLSEETKLEKLSFELRRKLYRNDTYSIHLHSAEVQKLRMSRQTLGEVEVVVCLEPYPVEEEQLSLYIESMVWESTLPGSGII